MSATTRMGRVFETGQVYFFLIRVGKGSDAFHLRLDVLEGVKTVGGDRLALRGEAIESGERVEIIIGKGEQYAL